MKIVQQDFRVATRIWFLIFLSATLCAIYGYLFGIHEDKIGMIIFFAITGVLSLSLLAANTYWFSFSYEFRQKELITCSLFTFWRKKIYAFKDLTKIECKINSRGIIDTIYLYFGDESFKNRVGINMFQVDLGKVKLFLFANVEDMEEILVETYRVPNDD